jgi:hypothetical protein
LAAPDIFRSPEILLVIIPRPIIIVLGFSIAI